jgi:CheY-like chemotaxis protein
VRAASAFRVCGDWSQGIARIRVGRLLFDILTSFFSQAAGRTLRCVVDDEPDIREAAREILEQCGYRVTLAESGERALELYARARADMVILDLNMPGIGGYCCLERLRRLDPQVKVLISSGYSAQIVPAEMLHVGISAITNKPFRWEDMLHKIRVLLDGDVGKSIGRW